MKNLKAITHKMQKVPSNSIYIAESVLKEVHRRLARWICRELTMSKWDGLAKQRKMFTPQLSKSHLSRQAQTFSMNRRDIGRRMFRHTINLIKENASSRFNIGIILLVLQPMKLNLEECGIFYWAKSVAW